MMTGGESLMDKGLLFLVIALLWLPCTSPRRWWLVLVIRRGRGLDERTAMCPMARAVGFEDAVGGAGAGLVNMGDEE